MAGGKDVGKSELAAIFGYSLKTVTLWQDEGMPYKPSTEKGPASGGNRYNTAEVHEWLVRRNTSNGLDLDTERARLAKEQADSKAMANELDRGETINLEAAMIIVQRSAFAIRQKIINSALSKEEKQAILTDIHSLGDNDFTDVEEDDDIEDKPEEAAAS